MATIEIPYKPRPEQLAIHNCPKRWKLVICHRRFGKTCYAINELIKANFETEKREPRFAYIAPYLKQAKTIAWDYLKYYSRVIPGIKINESELRIDYPNGGRIRLFGADNPDSLRGIYLDGVVLDEYAQIAPSMTTEIIRPALSDRKGWMIATGTPKGRNHFWDLYERAKDDPEWSIFVFKASLTGIVDESELESARRQMSEDEYAQEYECSFTAAVQGAYYVKQINKAREDGRIVPFLPVETSVPVHTFWDLGRNDSTSIWFMQQVSKEYRFIDCYEANGEGLDHYARVLKDKDYLYGDHYLPHDVEVKELSTNSSRYEYLIKLGIKPIIVVPRVDRIEEGIEQTRQILSSCWFDETKCKDGIRALEFYQKAWDDRQLVFRERPEHNWASHYSDSFRQFAQGYAGSVDIKRPKRSGNWRTV